MAFDPSDYRDTLVLAGGDCGAEFLSMGLQPPDLWERANLDCPDQVRQITAAFLDAGATLLVTMTDAANPVAQADRIAAGEVTPDKLNAINVLGAQLCRAAVDAGSQRAAFVIGAIGPVAPLLTLKEIDEETLSRAYRRQAEALAEGGVDGILCRSFTELDALRIALEAAKAATNLPLIGSMVFDSGPDFTETVMHVTVPQAAAAIREAGASMVGCDHAEYPDAAADVVGMLRAACDLPVWVEINAGRAELSEDRRVYPETPKAYGERLPALAQAGATIIGGGYGATRDHIAAMRQARDRFLRRRKGRPSAPQ